MTALSTTPTQQARAPRRIRTRRIQFEYPADTLGRHFANGDLVMSHVIALLSSLFPEGEDFFVRSVRNYRDDITDPDLKAQVAGFIGQEAIHSREHDTLNERLQELGYPTKGLDRFTKHLLRFVGWLLPKRGQLAVTAALEHYTATLAEVLMTSPEARAGLDDGEVRSLLLWHAMEESEHKAVAYDVYQSVSGNYLVRTGIMHLTTLVFALVIVLGTAFSLLHDRAAYHPLRLLRSLAALRRSPFLTPLVVRRIADYNRRDFHPDDHDTTELLERWRGELFGVDGTLTDRLAVSA